MPARSKPISLVWRDWNSTAVGVRLAVLLGILGALSGSVYVLTKSPPVQQWVSLGGMTVAYLLMALVIHMLAALKARPRDQVYLLTLLMLAYAGATAYTLDTMPPAPLLLVPMLHAVLRLEQRPALIVVCTGLGLWVLLGTPSFAVSPEWFAGVAVEILPVCLLLWVIRSLSGEVVSTRSRITALSYKDELTELLNMRAFTRMLQAEHKRAARGGGQYALLMVDIEGLQYFNDRFGHEQGNRVITAVADAIRRSTRTDDLIARYGGDEFVVFLPGAGDDVAEVVSNRLAQNVYNITLAFDRSMRRVAVNVGRAIFPDSGSSIQEMMSFADRAMYTDKEFKRNAAAKHSDPASLKRQAGLEKSGGT